MARAPSIDQFLTCAARACTAAVTKYKDDTGSSWTPPESLFQVVTYQAIVDEELATWVSLEEHVKIANAYSIGKRKGAKTKALKGGRFDIVTWYTVAETPRFIIEVKHVKTADDALLAKDVARLRAIAREALRHKGSVEGIIEICYSTARKKETISERFRQILTKYAASTPRQAQEIVDVTVDEGPRFRGVLAFEIAQT